MIRKFNFDYDYENDSLFLYDPKSKSKASIEIDDFIIDLNNKKEITGIELLNASKFFKGLDLDLKVDKSLLKEIKECKIDIVPKNNFIVIKFMILFESKKQLVTPVYIPTINEPSPAVAYT
ncbi:DUF2283 domain-containing protein [Candidatus Woesearchaeota archaeon]|nr:DUF2283 domain-containing protein [Candidatus Woesearchaeota archaeon]